MSDATPSRPRADRNLLFGILALQLDFIGRDPLIAAMHAWVLDKTKPLGQILVEQEALQPAQRALLEPLVEAHLERHGGDIEKSLAAVPLPSPLRHDLHSLGDGEVQASLAQLSTPTGAEGEAAPHSTAADATSLAGRRYQVLRPHGKGGLGEVFVALDQELRREVALKEIRSEHADDPHSRGRFVREAEITGGLEHPGVVPVHGLGTYDDGRPFYAMRFIQGETLKDAIDRYQSGTGGWTLRALLTRFVAVCNTVAYAHSRGVLHRDLKPANVMLGRFGETLLVDWGLAKPLGESAGPGDGDATVGPVLVPGLVEGIETQAGAALGTPAYMSPEQALGRLDQTGPASDIYGLGATLYTVLTGRPPVEGKDTAEVLGKAQRGEWLPPRRVKADVPAPLDAICRKALALRPEQRYGTALELAADVERWLADEPVAAYAEPWMVRARRWMRRHRTLVSTAVGVLMVALLGVTVGLVQVSDARDKEAAARKTAEDKEEDARKQKEEAERRREEARFNQYVAQMNLVQRDYEANNISRVRELLEAQVPQEPDAPDFRDFEWYYWQRLSHRELLTLEGHTAPVRHVVYSPDGRRLASCGFDDTVRVWDAASGQELFTLKRHTGQVFGVAYSPDGRRLASWGFDRTVRVCDAAGGQELLTLQVPTEMVFGVAYSPDSRRLASWGGAAPVRVWDTASGQQMFALKGHSQVVFGATFSPDGRRLAAAGQDMTLRVYDTAGGQELLALKGHTKSILGVAYSPDGRRLASASHDTTVRVWDATGGRELLTLRGHTREVQGVAYSPDGRRLASWCQAKTVRVWDAAGGRELFALKTDGAGAAYGAVFSPNGRQIASTGQDETVQVCDAADGQELFTFKGHTRPVAGTQTSRGAVYSPDGRQLASVGADRIVRVWDVSAGQELLTLKGHTDVVSGVAFSPDGQRLASSGHDKTVRIWDAATGQELLVLKGHPRGAYGLAYSRDGRRLASAGVVDGTVRVWDAADGQELLALKGREISLLGVAFSPDGRRLAAAGLNGTVQVWDAVAGQAPFILKGHTGMVGTVAFSPDGRRLASAGVDGTVRLWDPVGGQEMLTLRGHTGAVSGVAYSRDGQRLASAGVDGTVRVWDVDGGKELLTLKGHTSAVRAVAYSPDGRRLASAGLDRTVRVWDAASGQELLALKGHTDGIIAVAYGPDGRRLASAGHDKTVRVWEVSAVPAEIARRRGLVSEVHALFTDLFLREDVVAALRKDRALDEADREFAVRVAQTHSAEDASALNEAAGKVVKGRDAGKDACTAALRRAEAAARLAPGDGSILNTLGVTQYRLGDYAKALETLERSEKLNAAKNPPVTDLAFLAMAHHQLGHKEQARATLTRLREVMKQPAWAKNAEAQGFLREAEELIDGKPADKKE
jgi:WD40 repeat protein/tRNA A-37 threonylcarbamoyl transferase component Bud32/Flp pilus assembly protein TadD